MSVRRVASEGVTDIVAAGSASVETKDARGRDASAPESDKNQLQTLTRGAAVLNLLLERDAFTLSEASEALGLGTTVTYRLLRTWLASGYLQVDRNGKRYAAGLTLMRLAAKARATSGLPEAGERLEALSRRIDQTCSCAVLAGRYVLYVARVLGNRALTYHVEVGKTLPAEATSTGHALLAFEEEDRVRDLFPEPRLSAYTDATLPTVDDLLERLRQVRSAGFAVNEGQLSQAISAVAVPVRDAQGDVVATFSIAGPSTEVTRPTIHARYLPALLEAAEAPMELRMGVHG